MSNNLIANSGFEGSFADFLVTSGGVLEPSSDARFDTRSLKFTAGGDFFEWPIAQRARVTPGKPYVCSVYLKGQGVPPPGYVVYLFLRWYDALGSYVNQTLTACFPTNVWDRYVVGQVAPAGAAQGAPLIYEVATAPAVAVTLVDGAQFEERSPATDYAPRDDGQIVTSNIATVAPSLPYIVRNA